MVYLLCSRVSSLGINEHLTNFGPMEFPIMFDTVKLDGPLYIMRGSQAIISN